MRINGRVIDAASETPLSEARVVLRVGATEIARLRSDQEGEFEYETNQIHIGDTLSYVAEAAGYVSAEGAVDIHSEETSVEIALSAVLKAAFTPQPESGKAPLQVRFTNQSVGATSYRWSFGDGEQSTEHEPEHTYAEPGSYRVQLAVIGAHDTGEKLSEATVTVEGSGVTSGEFPYWQWIVFSAIGSVLGAMVSFLMGVVALGIVNWVVYGAAVGLMQWLVVRKRIPANPLWIAATSVGMIPAAILSHISLRGGGFFLTFVGILIGITVSGAATGSLQWILLKERTPAGTRWIAYSAVGWGIAGLVGGIIGGVVGGAMGLVFTLILLAPLASAVRGRLLIRHC